MAFTATLNLTESDQPWIYIIQIRYVESDLAVDLKEWHGSEVKPGTIDIRAQLPPAKLQIIWTPFCVVDETLTHWGILIKNRKIYDLNAEIKISDCPLFLSRKDLIVLFGSHFACYFPIGSNLQVWISFIFFMVVNGQQASQSSAYISQSMSHIWGRIRMFAANRRHDSSAGSPSNLS